jgi:hypothetical protein
VRLQLIAVAALVAASSPASAEDWTIASDSLVYGDTDNVVVVSPQLTVRRELDDDGGEATARAVVDVISAASVDVVSQASERFDEVRTEIDLSLAKAFGGYVPSLGYRYSHEPDYESHGVRGGLRARLGTSDTCSVSSTGSPRIGSAAPARRRRCSPSRSPPTPPASR